MKEYQIGNKITCIVRAYTPGNIGDTAITYQNEPYTVLKNTSAIFSFRDKTATARAGTSQHSFYDASELSQIRLSDVHLTDKVLQMVFKLREDGLCSHVENIEADDEGKIYLTTDVDMIYQVFIYNSDMKLEQAHGSIVPDDIVLTPQEPYLIIYQTASTGALNFNSPDNRYFTLDFICEGNTDEATSASYIHVEKAGVKVDKNLYFNDNINAVDLTFNVLSTDDNYIILQ